MAIIVAVKTGVFSDPTSWSLGRVPAAGDTVHLNGNEITIDQDVQADLLSTSNTPGYPSASGQYVVDSIPPEGRIIDASVEAAAGKAMRVTAPSGELTITGTVTGGAATNACCVDVRASAGPLTINLGEARATSYTNAHGIQSAAYGVTVNCGDAYGAPGAQAGYGILVNGVENRVFCRDIFGGGGSGAPGVYMSSVSGSLVCRHVIAGTSFALMIQGAYTNVEVQGNLVAGPGVTTTHGLNNGAASSIISVGGDVIASEYGHGLAASSVTSPVRIGGKMVNASNGRLAVFAPFVLLGDGEFSLTVADQAGELHELSNFTGSPPREDVRLNVPYGSGGTVRGVMEVPPAESVAGGVPVDNTFGSSALRLPNVSAVIGAQIAASMGE